MSHFIITKWIEPYVLLEKLKANYDMKDYTFDGFSKLSVKDAFLNELKKENTFGLYMKNVNKYYLFKGGNDLNLKELFGFTQNDYELADDYSKPLDMVDSGKAEAAVLTFC